MKTALITGVTGQDGAYLAEFLLGRTTRCTASSAAPPRSTPIASIICTRTRTSAACAAPALRGPDGCDQPDTHHPAGAAGRDLQPRRAEPRRGVLRDARVHGQLGRARRAAHPGSDPDTRARRARAATTRPRPRRCSARCRRSRRRETTPFYPRSPVRRRQGRRATGSRSTTARPTVLRCNGILFNHESPRRGETFVTRKITRAPGAHPVGLQTSLFLGQSRFARDWGHARDYVARSG